MAGTVAKLREPAGRRPPLTKSPPTTGRGAIEAEDAITQRERELGAIILAYNEVTDRLKESHERLSSEAARLRDELRAKNEELRRRERLSALGQMAAGLAHEIRNPLGGIALYASMLEGQLHGNPPARQAAARISAGVRSLDDLIRGILDFAQEGRVDRRRCRLGEVMEGMADVLRPCLDAAGAKLEVDARSEETILDCDPVRLRQVLVNLVTNGVQAAGAGGRVWISARGIPDESFAEIDVVDNGPGIDPAHLERVFNPFFTTRETGTGLGLAISHRIVEAHGGSIRAENRTEGGARFSLRLPYAMEACGGKSCVTTRASGNAR